MVAGRLCLEELRSLPERQRRILLLFAFGFTYVEIAERTGDTVRTVERQLCRARQGLRSCDSKQLPLTERAILAELATRVPIAGPRGVSSRAAAIAGVGCAR